MVVGRSEGVSEGGALVFNVDGEEVDGDILCVAVGGLGFVTVGSNVCSTLGIKVAVDEGFVATVNATSSLSSNGPIPQNPTLLVESSLMCRILTCTA